MTKSERKAHGIAKRDKYHCHNCRQAMGSLYMLSDGTWWATDCLIAAAEKQIEKAKAKSGL